MKFTLDKKILTGFISCSVILLVVAVLSFSNSDKFIRAAQRVTHTQQVLFEFEQILLGIANAEAAVRGFAIAGNEEFMDNYAESRQGLFDRINRVSVLTQDNHDQQENIDRIKQAVLLRIDNLERVAAFVRNNSIIKARD